MNLQLKIHIYADGANIQDMLKAYKEGTAKGFTTNPTLMNKAGIKDYKAFAQEVCAQIRDLPISFEVFSDDFLEMKKQAHIIAGFGANANVKIPITNTKGQSSYELIRDLLNDGLKLNVTAIMTQDQIDGLRKILKPQDDVIVSIFAGRIADTGRDPIPVMKKAVQDFSSLSGSKILWASPREALNIYQANDCGVHIITVTSDLLAKLKLYQKDLGSYSLDTVKMFYDDAQKSQFQLS